MAKLSRTFEKVKNVYLLSITRRTGKAVKQGLINCPDALKGAGNWFFLVGDNSQVNLTAKNSAGDLLLIDTLNRIRGYYCGSKANDINRLFLDAAHLAEEK